MLRRLVLVGVIVGVAAVVASALPDLARYWRIREM